MSEAPTASDAARLVQRALGERAVRTARFATGHAHYVYDTLTESGRAVVVRIAQPGHPQSIAHAVAWSELLRPIGVPLPALLHADPEGRLFELPSMLLERLPGTDLGHCHAQLSAAQKHGIAAAVCEAQRCVQALPPAPGYGFAATYDGPFLATWRAVVEASLQRSRTRIHEAGIVDPDHVERVAELVPGFAGYFATVAPRPFMDDTTTKNVIVHEGRLAGIVDVDQLCFGDPLFTVALTRASLLNLGFDLDYVVAWCALLGVELDALELYTALFLVDFLSELGQRWSRAEARVVPAELARLEGLLAASLDRLGGSQR